MKSTYSPSPNLDSSMASASDARWPSVSGDRISTVLRKFSARGAAWAQHGRSMGAEGGRETEGALREVVVRSSALTRFCRVAGAGADHDMTEGLEG